MAAMMASQRGVIITQRNMRHLCRQVMSMSSSGSNASGSNDVIYHDVADQDKDAKRVWPDTKLSTLDPYDQFRFPMPGNMGPGIQQADIYHTPARQQPVVLQEPTIIHEPSRQQTQADVIKQFEATAAALENEAASESKPNLDVELTVQECPELVKRDLDTMFPGRGVMGGELTVVTMCQKTTNDMSGWSEKVEEERDTVMELYVEAAKELCSTLQHAGYWADFIDPCSGKPHLGRYTTDTMFETDERYRHFGFEIEDLGCCKVIKHHRWGTKAFVGCIFTNAPPTAPILTELTEFADQV